MSSDYFAQTENEPEPALSQPTRQSPASSGKSMWLGCLLGMFATVVVVVLVVGAIFLLVGAVVGLSGAVAGVTRGAVPLTERTISGAPGNAKVAIVPIYGILAPASSLDRDPVELLRAMLNRARSDSKVRGIILDVDSPGGGITTCDLMWNELVQYRERTRIPVVVLMENIAASGGYYVSCGADYIMAHPTTITGSIGVMMPIYDAGELMSKLGVRSRTVKTGKYKDMADPFGQKTEAQWDEEVALLSSVATEMYDRFVRIVADGRRLDPQIVRPLADGRIYTAQQAKDNGLIDEIGYREDAIRKVEALAGLKRAHVVEYGRVPTLIDLLPGFLGRGDVTIRLDTGAGRFGSRPMYLWAPDPSTTLPSATQR